MNQSRGQCWVFFKCSSFGVSEFLICFRSNKMTFSVYFCIWFGDFSAELCALVIFFVFLFVDSGLAKLH